MNPCDEYSVKRSCYLDNRLQARELDDFRAHLKECAHCRAEVEADQAISRLLSGSRPLYSAPAALRAQVSAAVEQHAASLGAREGFYERLSRIAQIFVDANNSIRRFLEPGYPLFTAPKVVGLIFRPGK